MRIKSPVVTLIVGVLIGVVILVLSVRADHSASRPSGAVEVAR